MCIHRSKDELHRSFEAAQQGIDPGIVRKVMKGVPFEGDKTSEARALRTDWSRHHTALRNS